MSRLPRGGGRTRASVAFDTDELEQFDAICDEQGVSRSAKIRELVASYVESHTGDGPDELPDDPRLADAYLKLLELAEQRADDELRVTLEQAKSALYDNDTPKKAVKGRYLSPLKKRGWVDVRPSIADVWVYVRPP